MIRALAVPSPLTALSALSLLLVMGGCRVPKLQREPWAPLRAGSFSIALKPALFDDYEIEGDFVAETPIGDQQAVDTGDVLGTFGLALRGDWNVSDDWSIGLGVDLRRYVVRDLSPIAELPTEVDPVESLQYYLAARRQFEPFDGIPRLRPYAQLLLSWFPAVDLGFALDLSGLIADEPPLHIDSKGSAYWLAGLGTGLLYQWDDHTLLEIGVLYEQALTSIEADLTVEFGSGGTGFEIPFDAMLDPSGFIVFIGLSYTF